MCLATRQFIGKEVGIRHICIVFHYVWIGYYCRLLEFDGAQIHDLKHGRRKKDEQLAIRAAATNVRLDGDIILQQNEVLNWQAEGAGSMQDIR